MLAIAARDRGEVPIAFQALTYPMLDDRTGSTVHKPPQQGAILWKPESNRFGWTSLLGVPAGSAKVPPGSVPAREHNLKGLPPTFIGVGSIDLFVDEDVDYARRLLDSGVFVDLVVSPGGFHGSRSSSRRKCCSVTTRISSTRLVRGLGCNARASLPQQTHTCLSNPADVFGRSCPIPRDGQTC